MGEGGIQTDTNVRRPGTKYLEENQYVYDTGPELGSLYGAAIQPKKKKKKKIGLV